MFSIFISFFFLAYTTLHSIVAPLLTIVELKNKMQIACFHRCTSLGGGLLHIPAHRQIMAWELRVLAARVKGMITIKQAARRRRHHRHYVPHIIQTNPESGIANLVPDPNDDGTGFMAFVLEYLQPADHSAAPERLERLRQDIQKFLFCRCKPPMDFRQLALIPEVPENVVADPDYLPSDPSSESSGSDTDASSDPSRSGDSDGDAYHSEGSGFAPDDD